jgi:hypothetical protein
VSMASEHGPKTWNPERFAAAAAGNASTTSLRVDDAVVGELIEQGEDDTRVLISYGSNGEL